MRSLPDHEFTGTIARFTIESRPGGGAALIAFTDGPESSTGYVRLELTADTLAELAERVTVMAPEALPDQPVSPDEIEREVTALLVLMRQRGGPELVSLNDAIEVTGRSRATAARRLKEARAQHALNS
ncbi:hypothetical protein ACFVZ3_07980 [Kitasatospora purpeofusca]|uniref:hypothetical protein n=1 Tax=Kitasatospora purpeofusca TaxID=67352 RepID=UPI0036B20D84